MDERNPRAPTEEEKDGITDAIFREQYGLTEVEQGEWTDMRLTVEESFISVYDNYMPGSPGYCGKILMVVYIGGVNFYELFVEREGRIEREMLDPMLAYRDCEDTLK